GLTARESHGELGFGSGCDQKPHDCARYYTITTIDGATSAGSRLFAHLEQHKGWSGVNWGRTCRRGPETWSICVTVNNEGDGSTIDVEMEITQFGDSPAPGRP